MAALERGRGFMSRFYHLGGDPNGDYDGDNNDGDYDEAGETVSGECDNRLGHDRYQGGQGERPKEANTQKKIRMI